MKAMQSRYSCKCMEIFADFPAAKSCVVFSHGTIILFDKYVENIEMKAKMILKEFWLENEHRTCQYFKIARWANNFRLE